jgi:hypothetical protein
MDSAEKGLDDTNTSNTTPDSAELNDLGNTSIANEIEGVALLRHIFPEESTEKLKLLHRRYSGGKTDYNLPIPYRDDEQTPPPRRPSQVTMKKRLYSGKVHTLPYDFLRLSPDVAVRRFDESSGRWRYELVSWCAIICQR